ncbi:MAG TPA: hypothetical protein DCL21_02465 [Alphaproteobacteria bacterium]|nr:hypothetical protein [Alphaproteobacteria bacterium]
MLKKGAMFGLDARIALAIFGALSVISGAALYSAIQDAKATAFITEMQEIGKAWEQYYLDTGENLPIDKNPSCAVDCHYKIAKLVSASITGWKGPYLTYSENTDWELSNGEFNLGLISASTDVAWGLNNVKWADASCSTGRKCYNWVVFYNLNLDSSLAKKIDSKIDGVIDGSAGLFRWRNGASSTESIHLAVQVIPNNN